MRNDKQGHEAPKKPQQQTGEEFGTIKGPQRGPNDFKGKSDTPRGAEPELRGVSGKRD